MANVIRHKRGTSDPSASDFSNTAELLVNTTDGGLFTKDDSDNVVEIGGGGGGGSLPLTGGTLTGDTSLENTKKIIFKHSSGDGASIKHQSGHLEINNDVGNVYFDSAISHILRTNGSTAALTLDSSQNATFAGDLYVGTSTALFGQDKKVQIASTEADAAVFLARFSETDSVAAYLHFAKSSNGTLGQNGEVANGELLGRIYFSGDVGNGTQSATLIESYVDGSVTTNGAGLPGKIVFKTAADASSAPTTVLTLGSDKSATFAGDLNLANTKTIKFPGADTNAGATIKHQSGHLEINNDTGSVYFDSAVNHILRTNGNTVALTLDSSQNATFAGDITAPTFVKSGGTSSQYLMADGSVSTGGGGGGSTDLLEIMLFT